MPVSEFLVDRIRQRLSSVYSVIEKNMMGGLVSMKK